MEGHRGESAVAVVAVMFTPAIAVGPQVSDDEDDTHPNIDTPSLFRWRHQARLEKMKALEEEKKAVEEARRKLQQEKEWVAKRLADQANDSLKDKLRELELEEEQVSRGWGVMQGR